MNFGATAIAFTVKPFLASPIRTSIDTFENNKASDLGDNDEPPPRTVRGQQPTTPVLAAKHAILVVFDRSLQWKREQ